MNTTNTKKLKVGQFVSKSGVARGAAGATNKSLPIRLEDVLKSRPKQEILREFAARAKVRFL